MKMIRELSRIWNRPIWTKWKLITSKWVYRESSFQKTSIRLFERTTNLRLNKNLIEHSNRESKPRWPIISFKNSSKNAKRRKSNTTEILSTTKPISRSTKKLSIKTRMIIDLKLPKNFHNKIPFISCAMIIDLL